jgi:hypothetical protein
MGREGGSDVHRNRRSALLGTGDCVETSSTEQIIGFRSNRHTPERASP